MRGIIVGTVCSKTPLGLHTSHSPHKAKSICVSRPLEAVPIPFHLTYLHPSEAGNSLGPWNSVEPDAPTGAGFSIQDTMHDSPASTSQPCGCLSKEGSMGLAETKSHGSEPLASSEMENKAVAYSTGAPGLSKVGEKK